MMCHRHKSHSSPAITISLKSIEKYTREQSLFYLFFLFYYTAKKDLGTKHMYRKKTLCLQGAKTTVTSAKNNTCICQILYWVTFQVTVQAALHTLRLQLRRLQVNTDQMEATVTTVALANNLWLYSRCIHSWGQFSVTINTTAPSSLIKAAVAENQSIQRLIWWLSYVHSFVSLVVSWYSSTRIVRAFCMENLYLLSLCYIIHWNLITLQNIYQY